MHGCGTLHPDLREYPYLELHTVEYSVFRQILHCKATSPSNVYLNDNIDRATALTNTEILDLIL